MVNGFDYFSTAKSNYLFYDQCYLNVFDKYQMNQIPTL